MRIELVSMLTGLVVTSGALADIKYRVSRMPSVVGGQRFTGAKDINNSGAVCGWRSGVEYNSVQAVVWDPDKGQVDQFHPGYCSLIRSDLIFITDAGHVIGTQGDTCPDEFWLWRPDSGYQVISELPGATITYLTAVNNQDMLIGDSLLGESESSSFLWTPENGVNPISGRPYDINDNGWRVGDLYVWSPDAGYQNLRDLPGMDGEPEGVRAVNNENQVLGTGRYDGSLHAFVWSPVGNTRWLPLPDYSLLGSSGSGWSMSDNEIVLGQFSYVEEWGDPPISLWCLWRPGRPPQILGPESFDPCETDWGVRYWTFNPAIRGPNNRGQFVQTLYYPPNPERWVGFVLTPYIPGDLDEDADCDLQDLAYLLSNFGRTEGANYAAGDLDCDQDVDLADLAVLLANFGETLP